MSGKMVKRELEDAGVLINCAGFLDFFLDDNVSFFQGVVVLEDRLCGFRILAFIFFRSPFFCDAIFF